MKKALRAGALFATILLLGLGLLAGPVFATTIAIDGEVGDWTGIGPSLVDGDDVLIVDNVDISQIYSVNNETTLFFRVDTVQNAATRWANTTLTLYIRIVPDAGFGTPRTYRFTANGTTQIIGFSDCGDTFNPINTVDCDFGQVNPLPAEIDIAVNGTNPYNEIAIPFSALGITQNNFTGNVLFGAELLNTTDGTTDTTLFGTQTLPTPSDVDLISFNATRESAGVKLTWETAAERQIAGFNVLRSATGDLADAAVLNEGLIFGEGDSVSGTSYSFVDSAPVAGGSYWLQVVNADGTTEEYGPVRPAAETASTNRVFIPLVRR